MEEQTILESLEQAYLNTLNITEEGVSNPYIIEESIYALSELAKSIILLVNSGCIPIDKRVYVDITENNNSFACTGEGTREEFLQNLYEHEILIPETTIGELIEKLKEFSPSLKVNVLGENNSMNKLIIDDTYLDKIVIVGVEH